MKIYKLIKKLPFESSPEIGFISKPKSPNDIVQPHLHYWNHNWFDPANHPEYWEEVVEKEYEILSFISQTNDYKGVYIIALDDNGNYSWNHELAWNKSISGLEEFLNNPNWKINSIKRLSDGVVFTIGDKITNGSVNYNYKIISIGFGILTKYMLFHTEHGSLSVFLKNAKHSKKPLFTTEDGVEIYEGDKYFELAVTYKPHFRDAIYEKIGKPGILYDYDIPEKRKTLNENGRYYFSTRGAAEEHAIMNKPCLLSINEIVNTLINEPHNSYHFSQKLKELCTNL